LPQLQIEDRFSNLIDKRGFKKYKDVALTNQFNVSYQYKLEAKVKEELLLRPNVNVVKRIDFDSLLLSGRGEGGGASYIKSKVEKYRFNDIKIDFQ
jgi:hypothetical protein